MDTFIWGVLSSLLAVFIIYLLKNQFHNLVNMIFFKVYPKISGKWLISHLEKDGERNPKERDVMELKQFGSIIKGINRTYEGDKLIGEDKIKGSITATGILQFTWESKTNDQHHHYGSAFIRVSMYKKEMEGVIVTICCQCERNLAYGEIKLTKLDS